MGKDEELSDEQTIFHEKEPAKKTLEEKVQEATLATLPEIISEIANLDEPVTKEVLATQIAIKFKMKINQVKDLIMQQQENEAVESNQIVSAKFESLIDLASDINGNVLFIVSDQLVDGISAVPSYSDGNHVYVPPAINQIPFLLPRADEIIKWYMRNNDDKLFDDLTKYLSRFCYITKQQAIIVCLNIFASYIQDHASVSYLPIIYLYGLPERGKSRLGKSATYVSFRGVVLNDLRDAHLIRLSTMFGATLFIDLRSAWKKVIAGKCDDLILGRFEKGHKVMRIISPEKGPFDDSRYYEPYGPTFIASNQTIDNILETRCLTIIMANKPDIYEHVEEIYGQEFRERLCAWRARALFKPLVKVDPIPGVQGRLWDISEILLQLCTALAPDSLDMLKKEIIRLASEKKDAKQESLEGVIIKLILQLTGGLPTDIMLETSKLLNLLNTGKTKDKLMSAQYLGLKLKAMGIQTKKTNGGKSHMLIKKADFDLMKAQYGL